MRSHELAKELLKMDDMPVYLPKQASKVNNVEELTTVALGKQYDREGETASMICLSGKSVK